MKASERRLLMAFLTLGVVLGSVLLGQRLRAWQHSLERKERDVELKQMESAALLAQQSEWSAKGQWLEQVQPVVTSELQANEGLMDTMTGTAEGAGLEVQKRQIETLETTDYYRPYGVALTLRGTFPQLMRWIHSRLDPGAFYVMPKLKILPDKEDPEKITAQVVIWRWYSNASPPLPEESAAETAPTSEAPVPAETATPPAPEQAPAAPEPPPAAPAPPANPSA